jgi:hypothetical protein
LGIRASGTGLAEPHASQKSASCTVHDAPLRSGCILRPAGETDSDKAPGDPAGEDNEGVKSGELTKKEAVRLEAQQEKIMKDMQKEKAGSVVTPAERAKLHHEQKKPVEKSIIRSTTVRNAEL